MLQVFNLNLGKFKNRKTIIKYDPPEFKSQRRSGTYQHPLQVLRDHRLLSG